ncbi:MAG: GtrA family protein [Fibrobacterota bacterium]
MSLVRSIFRSLPAGKFIKFGLVGGSGVFVNAGVLYMLTDIAGLDYRLSGIIAIEIAIINNFLWNYNWTWSERRHTSFSGAIGAFARFNVSSGLTALIVNWGFLVLLTELAGIHYQISNLIGIAFGTIVNFLVSHFWAFAATAEGRSHSK